MALLKAQPLGDDGKWACGFVRRDGCVVVFGNIEGKPVYFDQRIGCELK